MCDPVERSLSEQQQKQYQINQTMYSNMPQEQHQYLQNLILVQAQQQQILANHIWAQNIIAQQNLMTPLQTAPQQAVPPQKLHQQFIPERATLNLPFISQVRLSASPTPMPLKEKLFQLHPDDPCSLQNLQTPQKHLEETQLGPFLDTNQMNQDIVQERTSVRSTEPNMVSFQQLGKFHAGMQEEEQIQRMENFNSKTVGIEQTLPNPSKPIDVNLWRSVFGEEHVGMANVPRFEIIKLHDLLVLASKIVETSSFEYVENMSSFSNSDLLNRIKLIANTINLGINVVQFTNTYRKQPEAENNLVETIFTPGYGKEKTPTAFEEDSYLNYTSLPAAISKSTTPESSRFETPQNSRYDRIASICSIKQAMSSKQTVVDETPEPHQKVVSAEPVTEQVGEVQVAQIKEPVEGEPLLKKIRLTNNSRVPFTSSLEQVMTNTYVHVSENHNSSLLHCSRETQEVVSAEPVTEQVGEVQEPILKKVRLTNDSLVSSTSSVKQVVTNSYVRASQNNNLSQLHRSQRTPVLNEKISSVKYFTEEQIEDAEVDVPMDREPLLQSMRITTDDPVRVPAPEVNPVIERSSTADQSRLEHVEKALQADQDDPIPTNREPTLRGQVCVPGTQSRLIEQLREQMKTLSAEMQHKYLQIMHLVADKYSKADPPKTVSEFFDILINLCKEGRL